MSEQVKTNRFGMIEPADVREFNRQIDAALLWAKDKFFFVPRIIDDTWYLLACRIGNGVTVTKAQLALPHKPVQHATCDEYWRLAEGMLAIELWTET